MGTNTLFGCLVTFVVVGLSACGPGDAKDASKDATPGPNAIELPRDEAPHTTQIEWWYYTGTLQATARNYGFEAVVFQSPVSTNSMGYVSHFALTDVVAKTFTLGSWLSLAKQSDPGEGFNLAVGNVALSGHNGSDRITVSHPQVSLDLSATTTKPSVRQYGEGWMTIGSDEPFYYYSYTDMDVAGTITTGGVAQAVTGKAWMDHQWGNMGSDYAGWDWYSLRFDDSTQIMLFDVRRGAGNGFSGGTFIDAAGVATPLARGDFTTTAKDSWQSPHTGASYPQNWQVTVPSLGVDVTVQAVLPDQEVYDTKGTPIYWEGLCSLTGSKNGQTVSGNAYVELTGYAVK
jgi:predicted secreted hydrolase